MSAIRSRRRHPGAYLALCLFLVYLCLDNSKVYALPNCGTASNPSIPAGPTGCDVQFGSTRTYDAGVQTSVSLTSSNLVVEFHKSQNNAGVFYNVGKIDGMNVKWRVGSQQSGFNGYWPTVAVNKDGVVLVVYSENQHSSGAELYYRVGKLNPNGDQNQTINWITNRAHWDGGFHTSVSINNAGVILGVHEGNADKGLYYRIGHYNNPGAGDYTIVWNSGPSGQRYTDGQNPHISINNSNQIVEVHQVPSENKLHYIRGTLSSDGKSIVFPPRTDPNGQPRLNPEADSGAVALTDNGYVLEVDKYAHGRLERIMGKLNATDSRFIDWSEATRTDYVSATFSPAVATNGTYAIETAQETTDSDKNLRYSISLLNDRSKWMGDMLPSLGNKTLGDIVIPGSHDAGMYCGSSSDVTSGKTQNQHIYEQLQGGVRYFDLRVKDGDPQLIVHANSAGTLWATCDSAGTVMDDVAKFMNEGHKEVVVLKLSHFFRFGNCTSTNEYNRLRDTVTTRVGQWMYKANTHPAQVPVSQLLENGGKVVVVVDGDWAAPPCKQVEAGFYVYKDWCSGSGGCDSTGNPAQGEFTVYDQYSNTTNYDDMKNNQLSKFASFKGTMQNDPNLPCDLFLLSWTLTPLSNVERVSQTAAERLGEAMNSVNRSANGFIPNVVYVDYYEQARVTDTTLLMNRRFNQ